MAKKPKAALEAPAPPSEPASTIKMRFKETVRVKASTLKKNPRNWRFHPESQRTAFQGLVRDVGFTTPLLAFRDDQGELVLIDGHLRVDEMKDEIVPVNVVDCTEEEAKKVLLTHDPLSALAEGDADVLGALLREVQSEDKDVTDLLGVIANDYGITVFPPDDAGVALGDPAKPVAATGTATTDPVAVGAFAPTPQKACCPSCGFNFDFTRAQP